VQEPAPGADNFHVWRDGKITCTLNIPGLDEHTRPFFGRPRAAAGAGAAAAAKAAVDGDVWVWSAGNVRRLKPTPGQPGVFTLDEQVLIPVLTQVISTGGANAKAMTVRGTPIAVEYAAESGRLIVLTGTGYPSQTYALHVLKLPQ
jgi:hypothetical protein